MPTEPAPAVVARPTVGERARVAGQAIGAVFANPGLRRLQIASASFVAGDWAYTVALGVYAYDFGGATWVGIVGLIRMLPSALSAAFVGMIADRHARERVLLSVYIVRAAALAASALAAVEHIPALVFVLAGIVTVVSAIARPCEWSLRAALAHTPEELAATNVAGSMVEGVAVFVGPAFAGLLLSRSSPGVVFLASGQLFLWAALAAAGVRTHAVLPPSERHSGRERVREALAGVATVARERDPRLIVGLFAGQTFTRGALNVLVVVAAIRLLHMGDPGVGYLNSAFGVGNLIGAVAALALVARRRLAGPAGIGLVLWGAPIAIVALVPHPAAALVLLAIPGFGNGVLDVAGLTLMQRITPERLQGRVFGTLEAVVFAGVGIGSVTGAALVAWLGIRWALVAVGALLPAITAATYARLRDIDARAEVPERELALLRDVPLFAPLPAIILDRLAQRVERVDAPSGTRLIHEGDTGDRFYVIGDGTVRVSSHLGHRHDIGPGGYFGEIALLRRIPRTADVVAVSDVTVYALDSVEFVGAVTGDARSLRAAETVTAERLIDLTDRPEPTPVISRRAAVRHSRPTRSTGRRRRTGGRAATSTAHSARTSRRR